jgi:hypothetical protein
MFLWWTATGWLAACLIARRSRLLKHDPAVA